MDKTVEELDILIYEELDNIANNISSEYNLEEIEEIMEYITEEG